MAKNMTQEERQILKLVENLSVPEETRAGWAERIRAGEMNDELAEEIRTKLSAHEEGAEANPGRTRKLVEFANLVKRWRLASQSHNFGRR